MKLRFALVGAGWRGMYYVRVAKALPEQFECVGILCRSAEKAAAVKQRWGVHTVTDAEDLRTLNPDVVVVAVSKPDIAAVAMEWMSYGFLVCSETPAALDRTTLEQLWTASDHGRNLCVAEQYLRYPENIARTALLKQGWIGEPQYLFLSLAHDYHAMSLMRAFLKLPCDAGYTVTAAALSFPTVRTLTRQEAVQDGSVFDAKRTTALFQFDGGKSALYEFDPEQYRSPIRRNLIKIQGISGELINRSVSWLDSKFQAHSADIETTEHLVVTDDPNPNFHQYPEVTGISFQEAELYRPPFGVCGLSQDETAIAAMLRDLGAYARGEGPVPYSLKDALTDADMAIDLQEAIRKGTAVSADKTLPWYLE